MPDVDWLAIAEEQERETLKQRATGIREPRPEFVEAAEAIERGEFPVIRGKRDLDTVQAETEDLPLGETLERGARLVGGGAIRGIGDILALPAMVGDLQTRAPGGRGQAGPISQAGRGLPRPPALAPVIQEGFGRLAAPVFGPVTPQTPGEEFSMFMGEELGAGQPIAWPLRALAKAKVAAGSTNRFLLGLSDETTPVFMGGEAVGAFGAAGGRLVFQEAGPGWEIAAAMAGDMTLRNAPGMTKRAWARASGFMSIRLETIAEQDARIQREIIEQVRKHGGIEEFAKTARGRELLNLAAERFHRAMGREANVGAALALIDEFERYAADFGFRLEDMALPSLTDNPGLWDLVRKATASNPDLANHYLAATRRGDAALRRTLARMGPPVADEFERSRRLESALNVADAEAKQRIEAVASRVDEIKRQRAGEVEELDEAGLEALGELGEAGATARQKLRTSELFGSAVAEEWRKTREEVIAPLYDRVEKLANDFAGLRFGVSHTKKALADLRAPMREAGELGAPKDLFGIIDNWPASGIDFARLRDMQKTLSKRIDELKANKQFEAARELSELKKGVDADILEYEILEVDVRPGPPAGAAPGAGSAPGEENVIGLAGERSAVLRGKARAGLEQEVTVDPDTGLQTPFLGPSLREMESPPSLPRKNLAQITGRMREIRRDLQAAEEVAEMPAKERRALLNRSKGELASTEDADHAAELRKQIRALEASFNMEGLRNELRDLGDQSDRLLARARTPADQRTPPTELPRPRTLEEVGQEMQELREFLRYAETPEAASATRVRLNALEEERQAIAQRMRQPEGPVGAGQAGRGERGTIGYAVSARSEDSTVGLANERSREMLRDALDQANSQYRRMAEQFYDALATGPFVESIRTGNPLEHGDVLGLYLKPGDIDKPGNYHKRVSELVERGGDSEELMGAAADWLIADAYQRSVEMVKQADGRLVPRLNRRLLDKWKKRNSFAIERVPGVKDTLENADEFVKRARELDAKPIRTPREANVRALEMFVSDPQTFWDKVGRMGHEQGLKAVRDLTDTIRRSGDDRALDGLRDSFMTSRLVRTFTEQGTGEVSPQQVVKAIDAILDNPALRETVDVLFGPEHRRMLEYASRVARGVRETGKLPANVQAAERLDPTEAAQELATKGSVFNVIMGAKRRALKVFSATERFARSLTVQQQAELVAEAMRNPALLRDLLTRNPSDELLRGIRFRAGANLPTLIPRVERNEERILERRRQERGIEPEPPNRAVVEPPTASIFNPAPARSLFG